MAARLSISLWQFYGTLMVAICRLTPCSLWQFFCLDHNWKFWAFQSYFYTLEIVKNICVKTNINHVMLNITKLNWIDQFWKESLFEWYNWFKALAVVLSTPRFIDIDTTTVSHRETGVRQDLHLLWKCYPVGWSVENRKRLNLNSILTYGRN